MCCAASDMLPAHPPLSPWSYLLDPVDRMIHSLT